MVYLELSEDNPIFLDPSFKYYVLKNNASNAEEIMSNLEYQYDLTDAMLDLYDVSKEIESDFGSIDIVDVFRQYEIQEQDISDTLTHDVPSGKVQIYTALPNDKSDVITISLGDTAIYRKKSCFLYGKDLTIEYEFTETSSEMMYDMYGYDSIDDLTGNLGPYESYAQIYGMVKLDGNKVANGNSSTLGKKEMLKIDVASNGSTASFEKELTFGALYSIVFDYQIISPHEIAASYAKLPQTTSEQNKLNASNIYGSIEMMNTLSLLGKTYFSQVDTNNSMLSNCSDINYGRRLSVAVVDFTPDIYTQTGSSARLNKQGKIGIDVIGNCTVFTSRRNSSEDELKTGHSAGYLSSFYESETIKQFTGMQTVSTAEVLNQAADQNIDILYLSKSNVDELSNSSLSVKDKEDIAKLINEGNYVTVPSQEVSIGSWHGTGYIVYDPSTGENAYIINNNLNGGSLCSWVGLAFFCDIIASVVE